MIGDTVGLSRSATPVHSKRMAPSSVTLPGLVATWRSAVVPDVELSTARAMKGKPEALELSQERFSACRREAAYAYADEA